jgi:hypothetical protein
LKPRAATDGNKLQGSSLSLLSIDDPHALAETITKI